MDARYEGPTLSRFLSEDPNFIQGGPENWQNGESAEPQYAALQGFVQDSNSVYLANPQNMDPYSYVDDNPLKYNDPTGKQAAFALAPVAPFIAPELLLGAGAALTALTGVAVYDFARNDWEQNQQQAQDQIQNLANQMDISGDSGPPNGNPNTPKWGQIANKIITAIGIGGYLYCTATGYTDCEDMTLSIVGGNDSDKLPTQSTQSKSGSNGGSSRGGGSAIMSIVPASFTQGNRAIQQGAYTTAQSTALTTLYSAFTPTNQAQAAALKNVFTAFSAH